MGVEGQRGGSGSGSGGVVHKLLRTSMYPSSSPQEFATFLFTVFVWIPLDCTIMYSFAYRLCYSAMRLYEKSSRLSPRPNSVFQGDDEQNVCFMLAFVPAEAFNTSQAARRSRVDPCIDERWRNGGRGMSTLSRAAHSGCPMLCSCSSRHGVAMTTSRLQERRR